MPVAVVRSTVEQAAGAVVVQREDMLRARLEGDLADPAKLRAATHHHSRFGVFNEVRHFGALVGGVERQKHIPGAQGGQVEHQRFD